MTNLTSTAKTIMAILCMINTHPEFVKEYCYNGEF